LEVSRCLDGVGPVEREKFPFSRDFKIISEGTVIHRVKSVQFISLIYGRGGKL
jgi:hypothetical protein